MTRHIIALTAGLGLIAPGCANLGPAPTGGTWRAPDLRVGALAERTSFEERTFATTGGEPIADTSPAPAEGPATPETSAAGGNTAPPPEEDDRAQKARTGVYWTGVVLGAVGAAGWVTFATAGRITRGQLSNEYDEPFERDREQQLLDRGKAFNGIAIGSAALGIVGLGMAVVAWGLDHNACGRLASRRHRRDCGR